MAIFRKTFLSLWCPNLLFDFDITSHKCWYDNTSNKFAFQRDRMKVKVAVIFLKKKKLCHHSSAFIYELILILFHTNV